jgi:hypothetical protein
MCIGLHSASPRTVSAEIPGHFLLMTFAVMNHETQSDGKRKSQFRALCRYAHKLMRLSNKHLASFSYAISLAMKEDPDSFRD